MQTEFCPLCSNNGAKVRVKAYQLNTGEAVFMCSTDKCEWPAGYHQLLFMDRPSGRYSIKDWAKLADEFLANYLREQRDSLSELSAYTPPQTPGHSKDAIHDTSTTAGPSFSTAVKEDYIWDQQASTSESKDYELPVIDLVGDDEPIIENKIVSSEPLVGTKSERVLVIKKEKGVRVASKTDSFVANPFAKHHPSLVDRSVGIVDEKPNICVPEKSESLPCKKYRVIGKKSKSFTYKKQFDIFDDIKKAKSTNEQCKAKIAIKSKIDLDKLKPNEIKQVLFVNRKSKDNDLTNIKVESIVKREIKLELQEGMIKVAKKESQADVHSIEVEKKDPDASDLIHILNGDSTDSIIEGKEVSLENLNKQSSIDHSDHYDLDAMMKPSPSDFESGESWSAADHDLEGLLAILGEGEEYPKSNDNLLVFGDALNDNASNSNVAVPSDAPTNNTITVDEPLNALSLNDGASNSKAALPSEPLINNLNSADDLKIYNASIANFLISEPNVDDKASTSNEASLSKLPADNLMDVDDPMNESASTSDDASLGKPLNDSLMSFDDPMNDSALSLNTSLSSELLKDDDDDVLKVEDIKVEQVSVKKERVSKVQKIKVEPGTVKKEKASKVVNVKDEPMKQEMDIDCNVEDDTLQCTIEDDTYFDLFSPPSKPAN